MIKNILQDIGGIGLYGVISLCLFFGVFFVASLWAFIQKKPFCDRMSSIPLHNEEGGSVHER